MNGFGEILRNISKRGCVETFCDDLEAKVSEEYGQPVSLFRTLEDVAFACDNSGRIIEARYSVEDGVAEDVVIRASDLSKRYEEEVDSEVGNQVHSLFADVISGDTDKEGLRNQLRTIALSVKKDGLYWPEDVQKAVEKVFRKGKDCERFLESQGERITEGFGDKNAEVSEWIESQTPKKRYGRLPVREVSALSSEILESLDSVTHCLDYIGELDASEVEESTELDIARKLRTQANSLSGLTRRANMMSGRGMLTVAKIHDRISRKLPGMLTVSEHFNLRQGS